MKNAAIAIMVLSALVSTEALAGPLEDIAADVAESDMGRKQRAVDFRNSMRHGAKSDPSEVSEHVIRNMLESFDATSQHAGRLIDEPYYKRVAAPLHPRSNRKGFRWTDYEVSLIKQQQIKCKTLTDQFGIALSEYQTALAIAPVTPRGSLVRPVAAENRYLNAKSSKNVACIGIDPSVAGGRWVIDAFDAEIKVKEGAF